MKIVYALLEVKKNGRKKFHVDWNSWTPDEEWGGDGKRIWFPTEKHLFIKSASKHIIWLYETQLPGTIVTETGDKKFDNYLSNWKNDLLMLKKIPAQDYVNFDWDKTFDLDVYKSQAEYRQSRGEFYPWCCDYDLYQDRILISEDEMKKRIDEMGEDGEYAYTTFCKVTITTSYKKLFPWIDRSIEELKQKAPLKNINIWYWIIGR